MKILMPAVITMTFEEREVDVIIAALHYLKGGLLMRDSLAQESIMELPTPPSEYYVEALRARIAAGGGAP
jgi:hypothetical protein